MEPLACLFHALCSPENNKAKTEHELAYRPRITVEEGLAALKDETEALKVNPASR